MKKTILCGIAAIALTVSAFGQTAPAPATAPAPVKAATVKAEKKVHAAKPAAMAAPTAAEIADAKAKGMVWVNLKSGVIHKDGEHFGTTKSGKFMTEADAMKAGYHMAKDPSVKKTAAVAKVKPAAK